MEMSKQKKIEPLPGNVLFPIRGTGNLDEITSPAPYSQILPSKNFGGRKGSL
jgi:hypothetical protein